MTTTSSATTRQGEEDQSATQATILPARSFAAIFTALGWKGSLYVLQVSNQWPPILICNSIQLHCPYSSHRLIPVFDKKVSFIQTFIHCPPWHGHASSLYCLWSLTRAQLKEGGRDHCLLNMMGSATTPHHHQQIIVLDFAEGFKIKVWGGWWWNSMFHSTTSYL